MALTTNERQAAYIKKQKEQAGGVKRLSMWVDFPVYTALGRLSRHSGLSKRVILSRLVLSADDATAKSFAGDDTGYDGYIAPIL